MKKPHKTRPRPKCGRRHPEKGLAAGEGMQPMAAGEKAS